jgi:hypothetical protein
MFPTQKQLQQSNQCDTVLEHGSETVVQTTGRKRNSKLTIRLIIMNSALLFESRTQKFSKLRIQLIIQVGSFSVDSYDCERKT